MWWSAAEPGQAGEEEEDGGLSPLAGWDILLRNGPTLIEWPCNESLLGVLHFIFAEVTCKRGLTPLPPPGKNNNHHPKKHPKKNTP